MNNLPKDEVDFNLEQILLIMNQLTIWMIKSGIGYKEFTTALKPIFYQQALIELKKIGQKPTTSSISLLSGLHRKDVTAFKEIEAEGHSLQSLISSEPISVPARVIGLWLAEDYPKTMPFTGEQVHSFESLVLKVSSERHPRSILNELIRLGIAKLEGDQVQLITGGFIPSSETNEIRKLLSANIQSHLSAGLYNIFNSEHEQLSCLEEAVRVDELSSESVRILKEYSYEIWEEYSSRMLKFALERCEIDKAEAKAKHTFCLGIYQDDN